ncbi:MAG: glycosyltransferase [Thermoflavifilum sp.]|nr:glycosyltransferase [Thermoflavifilum sp.]
MVVCITQPNKGNVYSETFIRQQIDELKHKFEVKVLYDNWLPQREQSGKLLNPLPFFLMHKACKNLFHSEDNFFSLYGIIRYLKQSHIQVMLANYGVSGVKVWKACAQVNVPLVVHFHGFDAFHYPTLKRYGTAYREMFRYASYIVAVSEDMHKQLTGLGADEKKVVTIPYGVDIQRFRLPDRLSVGKSTEAITSTSSTTASLFLAVGRFTAKKAPHLTIKAFHRVLPHVPASKLIMVGNGELFDQCKLLARELKINDHIVFTGALSHDDIVKLMQQAHIFVQHSVTAPDGDKEGTPVAILEAAASGLPVVSTFHAGISEAVVHGQTGFLVQEGDVESMAKYMIQLAQDQVLRTHMGMAARKHMEQHYAKEKQIEKLSKLLLEAGGRLNV